MSFGSVLAVLFFAVTFAPVAYRLAVPPREAFARAEREAASRAAGSAPRTRRRPTAAEDEEDFAAACNFQVDADNGVRLDRSDDEEAA